MSKHDEFQDLERRLQENRPPTEPLPSDFKRRLRADLMEKATVNDQRGFTFGTLTAAAGAVLVLIGIPLLFWMIQGTRPLSEPVAGGPVSATRQGTPTAVAGDVADAATTQAAPADWLHDDLPETAVATDYRLGERVELAGYAVEPAGEQLRVTLYWRALAPLERAATVFVHLLDADGEIVAQQDAPPLNNAYPLPVWPPGMLVADTHLLPAAGGAQLGVGLYDPETLARWPAVDGAGDEAANGRILLPIGIISNMYDEAAEAYVNLYPGVELPPQEKNAPYPHPSVVNLVSISAVHLDPAAAEPTLAVDLVTHLNTLEQGEVTVSLADGTSSNSEPLVSASLPITVESGLVSTTLDLDLTTLPDNTPLVLTAVFTGEGEEIFDSASFTPADLWGHAADSVQFVHLAPVENSGGGPQPMLLFDGRVAYHLSDAYESGSFSLATHYESAAGNGGGGGGGGGGQALSPGVGLIWVRFGSGGEDLTADNWAERLTIEATLRGVTAAGEQVVVDTAVYAPE